VNNPVYDIGAQTNFARKRLSEIIYEDLKHKIQRGAISVEERLQEDNLTKNYATSRTPIRDALRKLEQENIIEKLPYGGYQVKELTMDAVEEVFGIRGVLEGYAAVLATQRATEAEIKEMDDILAKSEKALREDDYETFIESNTEFHAKLYSASRSEHLQKLLRNLTDYFYRYRKIIDRTRSHLKDSHRGHKKMMEKMKERDESAVEAVVREHIRQALRTFQKVRTKDPGSSEGVEQ
jgi:DNA-binding GntR family transcriptional regulator